MKCSLCGSDLKKSIYPYWTPKYDLVWYFSCTKCRVSKTLKANDIVKPRYTISISDKELESQLNKGKVNEE